MQINQEILYPFCLIWTTLPCISWFLPFIGHVAICDSRGILYEFLGCCINTHNISFGAPLKYVRLNVPETAAKQYDDGLIMANKHFSQLPVRLAINVSITYSCTDGVNKSKLSSPCGCCSELYAVRREDKLDPVFSLVATLHPVQILQLLRVPQDVCAVFDNLGNYSFGYSAANKPPEMILIMNPTAQFGKKMLNDFYLDPSYINVNHGSYGSCPKKVMEAKRRYEELCDFNTEKWYTPASIRFRFDAEVKLAEVRQSVAQFVNSSKDSIFMVENASDGFNGFVKSMKWKQGDVIVMPNTSYAMVKKTIQYLIDKYGVKVLSIDFNAQDFKSAEKILLKIQNTVNSYEGPIRLAITDHIGSVPAIIFPVEEIVAFYHEKGIPVFIDGAHAICQTDIDLKKINPDGYVSNFHKWAYAPKHAAFLYIGDAFKSQVHPTITGNFYGQGLARQFFWTGTRDFSSYCAVPDGLAYYQSFGKGAVRQYNHDLTMRAAREMARIWKTSLMTEDQRLIGYLNNIEAPTKDIKKCVEIALTMLQNFNCYPIFYEFDGKVYCRISAQIYNQLSDYQFAAQKFLDLLLNSNK